MLNDLLTGGDVARALGISRQRLAQLRDGEGFPLPVGQAGRSFLWRWGDVEEWLDTRRGSRPEVEPVLEHRLRQLERLGYRVRLGEPPPVQEAGAFPRPIPGWVASISMRGWGSVGSEGEHRSAEGALRDALERFYDRADRDTGHTDRALAARVWELERLGWRSVDDGGIRNSTTARVNTFEMVGPAGITVRGGGDSPREARLQAVEQAEEVQFSI